MLAKQFVDKRIRCHLRNIALGDISFFAFDLDERVPLEKAILGDDTLYDTWAWFDRFFDAVTHWHPSPNGIPFQDAKIIAEQKALFLEEQLTSIQPEQL